MDKHVVVQTGGWGNTYAVGEDLKQHSCMTNELGKAIFENCRHHDHAPCAQSKANRTAHPHYDSRCKNWWRFGKFILNERIPKTQHLGRETIMKFYTPEGNKVTCYGWVNYIRLSFPTFLGGVGNWGLIHNRFFSNA